MKVFIFGQAKNLLQIVHPLHVHCKGIQRMYVATSILQFHVNIYRQWK